MMMRRLVAFAIAILIGTPLVVIAVTEGTRLLASDNPIAVVPGSGWSVSSESRVTNAEVGAVDVIPDSTIRVTFFEPVEAAATRPNPHGALELDSQISAAGDLDTFAFTAASGDRIKLEVSEIRRLIPEPYLTLLAHEIAHLPDLSNVTVIHFATHGSWLSVSPDARTQDAAFAVLASGRLTEFKLSPSRDAASSTAGWIYVPEGATVLVRTGDTAKGDAPPHIVPSHGRELVNIAAAQIGHAALTILWILVVYVLQYAADMVLRALPRTVRAEAKDEIRWILSIARWGGIATYGLLTVKEVSAAALVLAVALTK